MFRTIRRPFARPKIGLPKFKENDVVGDFIIARYEGHSEVNKRTAKYMSKAQHWYYCSCVCGKSEYRSQQELVDPRRQQKCATCRDRLAHTEEATC